MPAAQQLGNLRGTTTTRHVSGDKPRPTPNAFEISAVIVGVMEKSMQVGATPFQVLDWATDAAEEAHARGGAGITPRGWHNCTTSWSKPRRGWRPCCGTSRGGPPADVHLHVEQIENFRMPPTTTWPRSTYGKPSPCSRGAPGGTEHGDVPPHQVDKRTLEANLLAASGEGDEHSDLP